MPSESPGSLDCLCSTTTYLWMVCYLHAVVYPLCMNHNDGFLRIRAFDALAPLVMPDRIGARNRCHQRSAALLYVECSGCRIDTSASFYIVERTSRGLILRMLSLCASSPPIRYVHLFYHISTPLISVQPPEVVDDGRGSPALAEYYRGSILAHVRGLSQDGRCSWCSTADLGLDSLISHVPKQDPTLKAS